MHARTHVSLALLVASALATACSDGTAPSAASPNVSVSRASGSGGGGTGGGGTGGGGTGGGGGGGGGTTTVAGKVQRTSAAVACDAGSTMSITIQRGFQNRAEVVLTAFASPEPTGPAIPPSTFPMTSLGGWWNNRLIDSTTGKSVVGWGGTMGASTPSFQETILGGSLTPGVHVLTFTATNQQLNPPNVVPDLTTLPIHETCTASVTVLVL